MLLGTHIGRDVRPYCYVMRERVATVVNLLTNFFPSYYLIMIRYTTNMLVVEVTGIEDVTLYPLLSVFLMGYHKLSFFIMTVPFIIRLANPNLPNLEVFKICGYVIVRS